MSEEKVLKDKILNFCDKIYSRELASSQKSGVTIWALYVALTYMIWKIIPDISKAFDNQKIFDQSILIFSYLIFSIFIILEFQKKSKYSKFDLRIINKINDYMPRISLLLIILIGVCTYSIKNQTIPTGVYVLYANVMFSAVFLIVSIIFIISLNVEKFRNSNFCKTVTTNVSGANSKNLLFLLFCFVLSISNLIFFWEAIQNVDPSIRENVLTFTFNLFIIFLIFILLISPSRNDDVLKLISNLERDLIFHNITNEEAKKRLDTYYLGIYLGDWLNDQINVIYEKNKKFTETLDRLPKFIEEIKSLDQSMKYEIIGRIDSYKDILVKDFDELRVEFKNTMFWIETKNINYKNDKLFLEITAPVTTDLDRILKTLEISVKSSLDELNALDVPK